MRLVGRDTSGWEDIPCLSRRSSPSLTTILRTKIQSERQSQTRWCAGAGVMSLRETVDHANRMYIVDNSVEWREAHAAKASEPELVCKSKYSRPCSEYTWNARPDTGSTLAMAWWCSMYTSPLKLFIGVDCARGWRGVHEDSRLNSTVARQRVR